MPTTPLLTGLREPTAIAVDSADNVWVAYTPELLSEYGPYPSQAKIGERTGFHSPNDFLAPDAATGGLYVGEFASSLIDEFDAAGNLVPPVEFRHLRDGRPRRR